MRIGRADPGLGLGFFPGSAWAIFFYLFLYLFPVVVVLVIRRRWRMAVARSEEVRRLARMAAAEAARAEIEAAALAYAPPPPPPPPSSVATAEEIGISQDGIGIERAFPPPPAASQQCVVCYRPHTGRCARCKAVRYCGGKCQIIHWRQGHKDECHPPRIDDRSSGEESASSLKGLQSDQSNPCGNSSELDGKFQTESDQSNPHEKTSELDGKLQTKPVETLSKRPSESKFSDVFSEHDSNESKLFSHTYGREITSDSFIDSSSLSTSLSSSSSSLSSSSSAAQPQPSASTCSSSSLPETYHDTSAREESRMLHHAKVGIGSCENSVPDYSNGRASSSETKLTRGLSASLSVNSLSCTSKLEPMVSSCKAKDVECRLSGPAGTAFVSFDNGSNSGPSKNACGCGGDHIHLNAESSQSSTKLMPETFSHQTTLPGLTSPSNLRDFKGVGVDKSTSVLSGRSNDECFEKSKNLKPQQSLQSVHRESSSIGGSRSFSHDASSKINTTTAFPSKSSEHTGFAPNGISDLKSSVRRVMQQFKPTQHSKSHFPASKYDVSRKYKMLFPYDHFVKLYNCDKVELHPCGLTNCGNSCYANAVLQCLAFTRPLTSYLVKGIHTNTCTSREWCFTCEFGSLIAKSKQGQSPVSPVGILSHIQNIGSSLGHGREEDAHEFLRYAIDTMQTVCLKEAGVSTADRLAVETTLIQLIFGGYLRSKIKCTRCRGKSERRERMMDLTVEIHGDIGTLEDALARFTATEILDGENKYQCNRCNSYERAKKKLTVLEAPNVLTIALKRFQSGKFGKLNKAVRFPELLNLAPYMSGTDDKSPVYSLYAVVVHQDVMNAAFSGHYVCYVKSTQGKWYKTDDSKVEPVEIERVLTKNAYMLLYARCLPRAPSLIRDAMSHDHLKTKKNRHKESFLSGPGTSETQVKRHDHPPPYRSHYPQSSIRSSDPFSERLPFPRTDSSSDNCSLFSCSDEGSWSTESTRDSTSTDEYIYSDSGRFSWSQASAFSEDSDGLGHSPLITRHSSVGDNEGISYGERWGWEGEDAGLEGKESPLILYSDTTNQYRKLTKECRGRENDRGVGLNEMQSSVIMKRSSTTRDRRDQTFY